MMEQDRFTELIPAYALGAADAGEAREIEAHLRVCAACRALAEEYRRLGDDMLFAAPLAAAPAGLTEDLRKKLNRAPEPRRGGRLDFLRRPGFAFAALALALLALTNVYWFGRVGRLERQAAELAALTGAPGVSLHVANAALSADGVVYLVPDGNKALLCVYALPPLDAGQTYQAWLIRDGQRVSGGTFDVNADGYGALLIEAGRPMGEYQQLGITVEPAGGSPAPTTPRIMGGDL